VKEGVLAVGILLTWSVWNSFSNHLSRWKREYSCNISRQYQAGRGLQALRRKNLKDWKQH